MKYSFNYIRLSKFILPFLVSLTSLHSLAQLRNAGNGNNSLSFPLRVADSNVVFTGPLTIPDNTSFTPPVEGPGSRLMWYAQKAAIRSGAVTGDQWDKLKIGPFSVAIGLNTEASGPHSIAIGNNCSASGQSAIALGEGTIASGHYAFATGLRTKATSYHATAIGNNTLASNAGAFAAGLSTVASGELATALGNYSSATGWASLAIGIQTEATGDGSLAMGIGSHSGGDHSLAMGDNSLSMGRNSLVTGHRTISRYPNELVVGYFNDTTYNKNEVRLFEIGNGSEKIRSNAFTVLEDGRVGIGTATPKQRLEVMGFICSTGPMLMCSDIRYKTNVTPLGNTLPAVLSLRGIYYTWDQASYANMHFAPGRQIGFSAQELERCFPELVVTDEQGYKSVDYGRMAPVLLAAIQEQQKQIEALKVRLEQIENAKK